MLNNMETILKEYQDPFGSNFSKQISFDQVADPNLEMSILIEHEPLKPDISETQTNGTSEPVKHLPDIPVEYEWPQRSGEFFLLKDNLAKFLEIPVGDDSISRVESRMALEEEKTYLAKVGLLKPMEDTDEIAVIRTEDSFQFMCETNRVKFQTYIECVHKRETKKLLQKQEAQRSDVIRGNVSRLLKRTLKETVKYNSRLNLERRETRCAYFDLQTQIIHLPQKKRVYDPNTKSNRSDYPLALLPGQYQDFYKVFTPNELKTFPINTVTSFPCTKKPAVRPPENATTEKDARMENKEKNGLTSPKKESVVPLSDVQPDKDPFCGICMKGPEMNKRGLPEKLIHCSQCENSGHPSCLDMNRHLIMVIKSYPWQCMECKVCTECLAPHDEEEMIFCDNCDRGYHSYCVGLKEIPKGRWVCNRCGKCASCLEINPVPEGTPGRWKNEHSKPRDQAEPEFLQVHCHSCSKLFRKGAFCPVCLKVYRSDDDHINPMVCCDECDRWIHTDCDGI